MGTYPTWMNRCFPGNTKGNMSAGNVITPEYKTVLAAMPTKPNATEKANQAAWVEEMVDCGYWSKAVRLFITAMHAFK